MNKDKFFSIYYIGYSLKSKGLFRHCFESVIVVSKNEWMSNSGYRSGWDTDRYLHVLCCRRTEDGFYDRIPWVDINEWLVLDGAPSVSKKSIYCQCNGKAKRSSMFYGDLFYICDKCGKEKQGV
jgi:hypothetical protein